MKYHKRNFKVFQCWLLFFTLFLISGCATSIHLTKADRESIQTVSVKESVGASYRFMWEEEPVNYSPIIKQADIGMITGGLVGGLTGMIEDMKRGQKRKEGANFLSVMAGGDISVENIVRQQVIEELKSSNLFLVKQSYENANAEFNLLIKEFGFDKAGFFSFKHKPFIGVEGSLVRPDGAVIWRKYVSVSNKNSNVIGYQSWEYIGNPELIREAITSAAKMVAKELIADITQ